MIRSHILVCGGTGCTSNKSAEIVAALRKELTAQGLDQEVQVIMTGCFGLCANGPIMVVYPEGACYNHVQLSDVKEIVTEHILKGRIVNRLLHVEDEKTEQRVMSLSETDFMKNKSESPLKTAALSTPKTSTST